MTEHSPDGKPDEPSPWAPAVPAPAEPVEPPAPAGSWEPVAHQVPAEPVEPPAPASLWEPVAHQVPGEPVEPPAPASSWEPVAHQVPAGEPWALAPVEPVEPASSWEPVAHQAPAGESVPWVPAAPASAEPVESQAPAGERVLFGSAFAGTSGPASGYQAVPPPPPPMRIPEQREPTRRAGGMVIGLTVLALIVGGAAGATGGYLVSISRTAPSGPVTNALDQAPPAKQTTTSPSGTVEAAAEKVLPTVVQLQVQGRSSAGEGSGFVISSDGLIVTNNHVVADAAQGGAITAVFQDGKTAKATIVGRDPNSDVAVVKAQGVTGLPVSELGRSDDLKVGQGVVAIGSPFELTGTVTAGIVSSLHRPTRAGGDQGSQTTVMDAIQTDAAINPGNSGGPLIDLQGRVIGINSAIYSPSSANGNAGSVGIGFAIPIDQARRTADEIAKTGKATQTILGVSVKDNTPQGSGALISDVTADGPASKAGLKQGDVVTQLDGRKIDTSDALVAAVRAHVPGDTIKLVLDNGARTIDVTLAGQPVPPN